MQNALIDLFNMLSPPEVASDASFYFSACPLPGRLNDFLAKDINNQPALLISAGRNKADMTPPPISLEHLQIDYGLECHLRRTDGSNSRGFFSVIRCLEADRMLKEYYLQSVPPVLLSLPANPSYAEIAGAVRSLAELFRLITSPGRKSIQGFWAELFLINRSSDLATLIKAWHSVPEDRYDFNSGNERIEVKSASGNIRMHHFSLEQLHPPPGASVLIASMFVESAGGGSNIFDLIENIRARISNDVQLINRVDGIAGAAFGSGWRRAMEMRFDQEIAEESLQFYDTSSVPSPQYPPPVGISQVHFVSDLSSSLSLSKTSPVFNSPLFRNLLTK